MTPQVSIIIRTKNEERWIGQCLEAVYSQDYDNFEVILVDNNSTDKTVEKARQWPVQLVTIDRFFPGRAINVGIEASSGEYLVCLSGHCIPKTQNWLHNLVSPLYNSQIAGVYGRQEPLSLTSDLDKRDLYITFGLDNRIQVKDSFFHNANSAFRRDIWEAIPFDNDVTNIEDRVWGREVLKAGYHIRYQANASVYHHHGIHQNAQAERAQRIVRIMEEMDGEPASLLNVANGCHNIAIVATRDDHSGFFLERLLRLTLAQLAEERHVRCIVLATNDPRALAIGEEFDCISYRRNCQVNNDKEGIQQVYREALLYYEAEHGSPDSVFLASETYPLRDKETFSLLYKIYMDTGADAVVCGYEEKRTSYLVDNDSDRERFVNRGLRPRSSMPDEMVVCPIGVGCVASASRVRNEAILSGDFLILPRKNPSIFYEAIDPEALKSLGESIKNLV